MRNNSGHDVNSNGNLDKTLKDNEGKVGTTRDGDFAEGAPFENAKDREEPDGRRSPSGRGRGEVSTSDDVASNDS